MKVPLLSAAAGFAVAALLVGWRGFFPLHAILVGFAVALLVYSTWRTVRRLRDLGR